MTQGLSQSHVSVDGGRADQTDPVGEWSNARTRKDREKGSDRYVEPNEEADVKRNPTDI